MMNIEQGMLNVEVFIISLLLQHSSFDIQYSFANFVSNEEVWFCGFAVTQWLRAEMVEGAYGQAGPCYY